jgi:hypothetical protein
MEWAPTEAARRLVEDAHEHGLVDAAGQRHKLGPALPRPARPPLSSGAVAALHMYMQRSAEESGVRCLALM